jgi:hypothetical protein
MQGGLYIVILRRGQAGSSFTKVDNGSSTIPAYTLFLKVSRTLSLSLLLPIVVCTLLPTFQL